MTIMVDSLAAGRQTWCLSSSESAHPDLHTTGREGGGRGRGREKGEAEVWLAWAFETSRLTPSDQLPLTRPHLLILLKQSTNWKPNIFKYKSLSGPHLFKLSQYGKGELSNACPSIGTSTFYCYMSSLGGGCVRDICITSFQSAITLAEAKGILTLPFLYLIFHIGITCRKGPYPFSPI